MTEYVCIDIGGTALKYGLGKNQAFSLYGWMIILYPAPTDRKPSLLLIVRYG